MIRSTILDPDYDVLFPYQSFPWRLDLSTTVCHFECEEHLQKYLDRYKLKPKDYQVLNRDGKSLKSSKKHKTNVSKRSGNGDHRSAGSIRKRKSSMDSIRDTVSNAKGTKCLKKSRTKKQG